MFQDLGSRVYKMYFWCLAAGDNNYPKNVPILFIYGLTV